MFCKNKKIEWGKVSFIMLAVFAVLLATDLITKECAAKYEWNFIVIKGFIEVVPVQPNSGAAFSFFADKEWGQAFFIAVTVVMLAILIPMFVIMPERLVLLKLALAMILAGAIGNLVDRCLFLNLPIDERGVRDFVYVNMFGIGSICNFADFWIVFGVIIAVVDMLFLNEYAAFPLTQKAKDAQKKREQEQKEKLDDGAQDSNATVNDAQKSNTTVNGAQNNGDNSGEGK
jgi:signal peptidase II